jgi:cysteate synthase
VVPQEAVSQLWSPVPFTSDRVRLVAVGGGGDYADAIRLADALVARSGGQLVSEGGARNVARRDGMALSLLSAAIAASAAAHESCVVAPDHYF